MSTKAERERNKAIDKNLRKVMKAVMPKLELEPGHKITGTTIGLITVPELHTLRTALLLNQNMPSHTRASLEVLRSVLGKVNDALRYCGEDISDINVRTEVFRSTGGENIQALPPQPPLDLEKDKKFPNQVIAESKHAYMEEEKRKRLGVKSKKKVRDDWD